MRCSYLRRLAAGLLLLSLAIAISACGSGAAAGESGETYGDVLRATRSAALAGRPYEAIKRAEELKPALRASIDSFCVVNRDLLINKEAWKAAEVGYYLRRIKVKAEGELPFVSTRPVNEAVDRYRALFGLDSFTPDEVRRYDLACYGKKLWY
jgi:hypothetical protein